MRLLQKTILLLLVITLAKSASTSGVAETAYDYNETLLGKLPKYVPNIEYLGTGYDIYFANPHSTDGQDPGFRNYNVFDYEYDADPYKSMTVDRNWLFPKGVRYNSYQACSMSYTSKQIDSMQSYRSNLQVGVSLGVSFPIGSFSASADYKQVENTIKNQSSLYIESSAQCTIVEIGLYQTTKFHPLLSLPFVSTLITLEAQGDNEASYHSFFHKFGTHITSYAKLGSLFGYRFEVSTADAQKMNQEGFNIEASASIFSVNASFKTDYQKSSESRFNSTLKTWKSFSVGAPPDPENDVSKWASQSIINPQPVSIQLISYEDLLTLFTRRDKRGLTDNQINNLKSRFIKYIQSYCSNYLATQNLSSCDDSNYKLTNIAKQIPTGFFESIAYFSKPIQFWNVKSGKALIPDLNAGSIKQLKNDGTEQYNWTFVKVDSQYQIKHIKSGKCIAVKDGGGENNLPVLMVDCQNQSAQKYKFNAINAYENVYQINVGYNNYLLAPISQSGNNNDPIVLIPSNIDCGLCNQWGIYVL